MRLASCLLAATALGLLACSGNDEGPASSCCDPGTGPADVADAFLAAATAGDVEGFESHLTAKARDGIGAGGGGFELGENVESFVIGDARVDGTEATVPVQATVQGEAQELGLCMRLEGDAWRIWGLEASVGGEAAMTIDLEHMGAMMSAMQAGLETAFEGAFEEAAESMRMGGSPEEIRIARERFDAIVSVAAPQHEAAWKVDVSADGVPALELLSSLVLGTGVALDAGEHGAALERPVTLELSGVSSVEAVERVCAEVELHPVYPDLGWSSDGSGPTLGFAAGPRPSPVAFAGPFLIEVARLEENAPNTTGEITLAVRALGLDPAVLAFQTEMVETLAVAAIRSPGGESVYADEGTTYYGTPTVEAGLFGDSTTLSLRGLLSGVRALEVEGAIHLTLPTWVVTSRFEPGEPATKRVGDYVVTRRDWGESTALEIAGAQGADTVSVRLAPEGADGEPMGTLYADSNGWGDTVTANLQTPAAPAAVTAKICTVTRLEYPFALEGVPLAEHAGQPAELTPLSFTGSAPIQIEFVRFTERGDFPKVELRIANTSNKVTQNASATFVYLDAAGGELEDFPHLLTGEFDFDGLKPLADPGATVTQETQAAFAPADTARLRFRIDEVTFVDGTEWVRE